MVLAINKLLNIPVPDYAALNQELLLYLFFDICFVLEFRLSYVSLFFLLVSRFLCVRKSRHAHGISEKTGTSSLRNLWSRNESRKQFNSIYCVLFSKIWKGKLVVFEVLALIFVSFDQDNRGGTTNE